MATSYPIINTLSPDDFARYLIEKHLDSNISKANNLSLIKKGVADMVVIPNDVYYFHDECDKADVGDVLCKLTNNTYALGKIDRTGSIKFPENIASLLGICIIPKYHAIDLKPVFMSMDIIKANLSQYTYGLEHIDQSFSYLLHGVTGALCQTISNNVIKLNSQRNKITILRGNCFRIITEHAYTKDGQHELTLTSFGLIDSLSNNSIFDNQKAGVSIADAKIFGELLSYGIYNMNFALKAFVPNSGVLINNGVSQASAVYSNAPILAWPFTKEYNNVLSYTLDDNKILNYNIDGEYNTKNYTDFAKIWENTCRIKAIPVQSDSKQNIVTSAITTIASNDTEKIQSYLPSIGELLYLASRWFTVNLSLNILNSNNTLPIDACYMSSTYNEVSQKYMVFNAKYATIEDSSEANNKIAILKFFKLKF